MLSFNKFYLTGLSSLKLCRQEFKNSWLSNGKIRFPTKIMLATVNSFKLMKSSHEYQIMKYFSAMLCQDVVGQNKMK